MKKIPKFLLFSSLIVLGSLFVLWYAFAWTSPIADPPASNLSAPLNEGSDNQHKVGYLSIATSTAPSYPLDVAGTIQSTGFKLPTGAAADKVLTSDASGVATWQTAAGGAPAGSTGYVQFNNAGAFGADSGLFWDNTNKRLGIGTTGPSGKLTVEKDNTGSSLTTLTNAHLVLNNPNASGQTMFIFAIDGVAKGGVRGDYPGNFNWHASGSQGHQFYGSINNATPILGMSGSGLSVGRTAGQIAREKLDVTGNAIISGNVGIGTTGPTAKLDIASGNIDIDNTTYAAQYGIITKNGSRFIHNFNYGNNGTVTTAGRNVFIGEEAGNLTMGSTATDLNQASGNTGIGYRTLYSNTTGYNNSAVGLDALYWNATGYKNSAMGYFALSNNTSGRENTAMGYFALSSNEGGSYSTAIGAYALQSSKNYYNTAIGAIALNDLTTGDHNVALGYNTGRGITTGSDNVIIGNNITGLSGGLTNTIIIGDGSGNKRIYVDNSGNVGIGTTDPWAKLEVNGTAHFFGNVSLYKDSLSELTMGGNFADAHTAIFRKTYSSPYYLDIISSAHPTFDSGIIRFFTSDQASGEKMRITSNGNVGIGTTGPLGIFAIKSNYWQVGLEAGVSPMDSRLWYQSDGTGYGFGIGRKTAASPYTYENYMYFKDGGNVGIGTTAPTYQLQLSTNSAAKPTSNAWTIASDIRVKEDIKPFTDGLNVINQLNPVSYTLNGKAGFTKGQPGISIIANDVKDIIPYAVSTYKAKLEPTDEQETELYDFDSSPLTFVTINAIKELNNKIEVLESENEVLNKRIEILETR